MTQTFFSRSRHATAQAMASSVVRRDIQGLRALGVVAVLLFHLWPNRLGGGYIGVDVFFVISGYLITSHLLRHPPTDLRGVTSFWARRIRRLLPASLLVLFVTLVASRLIAPETQWSNTAADVRAATLYVLNWRLAENSVDYLAADDAPSPVQHFWTLAVEEQFYAMWPLLILVLVVLAARYRRDALSLVLAGISAVVAVSFLYGLWMAQNQPASGYFVTPTRIWELGVGALLAGAYMRRERSGRASLALAGPWRVVATVVGLAAILWAAFTYSGSTPFPGFHAVLPVLGTALLIAIGPAARPQLFDRVLDNPAAVRVGDLSYSVYLWHWPMIVLLPSVSGGHLGRLDKAAILVATFVLAALTKTWVEDRFRRPNSSRQGRQPRLRPVFAWAAIGMAALVVLSVVQDTEVSERRKDARIELRQALNSDPECFGANATVPGARCPENRAGIVVPAPTQAAQDRGESFRCREHSPYRGTTSCTVGDPDGKVRVAIAGNSHALHWVPALDRIGRKSGWRITTFVAAGCSPMDVRKGGPKAASSGCLGWGKRVHEQLRDGRFDLVVMSTLSQAAHPAYADMLRRFSGGFASYIRRLTEDGGPPVVVIKDVPAPGTTLDVEALDCVAENRDDLRACSGPRAMWVKDDPLTLAVRRLDRPDVTTADLTDRFCDDTRCRSVIGGVMVYSDRSHLTATYSKSLARFLAEPITQAIDNG